jgi:hypothetical protein
MIPRELPLDLGTTAELRVHAALAELDVPGAALHSLLLPEHEYKLTAEIDFVVILDTCVLAVEVKGASVSCREGLWTYSDRQGHSRSSREGPFQQANSAMYALRTSLTERLGQQRMLTVPFGYLVVTPDVDLPTSVEWAEETYIGRGPFSRRKGFAEGIRRAATYWNRRHDGARIVPTDLRAQMLNTLRPDFDRSPGLGARAGLLDASFERLTADQYAKLDLISDSPRMLCQGGAGTGKTFLAVEVARRHQRLDPGVLFTCRSPVLAAFVRSRLAGTGVEVIDFDKLGRRDSTSPRVGFLVVDEAQDLMSLEQLDLLDRVVEGGLEHGSWAMFFDPNGQAHIYADWDPDALQMLKDTGAAPGTLRTNCRNTKEIAFQTRALTGADTGVAAAGSGPEVEFVTVEDPAQETARLELHLRELREQDVAPSDITLLSLRGEWASSSASGLRDARKDKIRVLDVTWAHDWPGDGLSWASVVDIKGLENRFICVIDVDALAGDHLDQLYVALSRARAGLWVALDPVARERVKDLYTLHAHTAFEALGKATS